MKNPNRTEHSFSCMNHLFSQRVKQLMAKKNGYIDKDYTIINKLGAGCCGTVYKINAVINNESLELAQKTFITGKNHERSNDDYIELHANWQVRKYISENIITIANDSFLFDCIERVPFLYTTKEQAKILSKAKSIPKEEYKKAQLASELKHGIFFEIKGNQNLDDLINSKNNNKLTFDDKMKLLLDIIMGLTLLDKSGIIQRDLNCENIQIDINTKSAYLIDFGKAIHKDIIHLFDDDENEKNDYCSPFYYSSPPEAYERGNKDVVFGDKYNSYNAGLIILPLFFGKNGYDLMYNFKWSNNEDIIKNRKDLFYNLESIIINLNKRIGNKYSCEQIKKIIEIMKKLLNTNVNKRSNAESIARNLYNQLINDRSSDYDNICSLLLHFYSYHLLSIALNNLFWQTNQSCPNSKKENNNSKGINRGNDDINEIID